MTHQTANIVGFSAFVFVFCFSTMLSSQGLVHGSLTNSQRTQENIELPNAIPNDAEMTNKRITNVYKTDPSFFICLHQSLSNTS